MNQDLKYYNFINEATNLSLISDHTYLSKFCIDISLITKYSRQSRLLKFADLRTCTYVNHVPYLPAFFTLYTVELHLFLVSLENN